MYKNLLQVLQSERTQETIAFIEKHLVTLPPIKEMIDLHGETFL
jgi:hypothetical protein